MEGVVATFRARMVEARAGMGSFAGRKESGSMELMLKWRSGSESESETESGTLDNVPRTLMKLKARSRGFTVECMLRL